MANMNVGKSESSCSWLKQVGRHNFDVVFSNFMTVHICKVIMIQHKHGSKCSG